MRFCVSISVRHLSQQRFCIIMPPLQLPVAMRRFYQYSLLYSLLFYRDHFLLLGPERCTHPEVGGYVLLNNLLRCAASRTNKARVQRNFIFISARMRKSNKVTKVQKGGAMTEMQVSVTIR